MTLEELAENHGLTPEGVDYALAQYQIVLCEITHGMLSKLSYNANDIIRIAQDRWCETCDLKEQKEAGGWISVKDRMPEVGEKCLIYRDGQMSVAKHIANNDWITQAFFTYPTHWMPLPEPPKEDEDD